MSRLRRIGLFLFSATLVLLVAYVVARELESRGYIELPRAEIAPETVAEAREAVIGDHDPTCLESDVEVLAGYWRWMDQFRVLEDVSVQRAGANAFINLLVEHRIALIDLAPPHGCTGVFEALDLVAERFIDYITEFRQNDSDAAIRSSLVSYISAVESATDNLQNAIVAAAGTPST